MSWEIAIALGSLILNLLVLVFGIPIYISRLIHEKTSSLWAAIGGIREERKVDLKEYEYKREMDYKSITADYISIGQKVAVMQEKILANDRQHEHTDKLLKELSDNYQNMKYLLIKMAAKQGIDTKPYEGD